MPVQSKPSAAQSGTSSGVLPDFPQFAPDLVGVPGGQETNAAIQDWWNTAKYQLLQQANTQQQTSLKIQASSTTNIGNLTAALNHEITVRADADSALATDINTVSVTLSTDIATVTASVVAESTARITADGFLSGKYTLTVTAGNVVTGMNITSSSGSGTPVSNISFTTGAFQIYDGSSTSYPVFNASAGIVTLASTLVINTSGKVFIGTGTYANANTAWYVDATGKFSLKDKLTWDGSTLSINGGGTFSGALSAATGTFTGALVAATGSFSGTVTATSGAIGGWTIGATTLSNNNAILDSAGQLVLGTSNDIVYLSAIDATYRIWIGNTAAASATFRVSKTGAMSALAGVIGGWTINSTTLSNNNAVLDSSGNLILGTANDVAYLSATDATYRLWIGNATAGSAAFSVTKGGVLSANGGTFATGAGASKVVIDSTGVRIGDVTASNFYFWSPSAGVTAFWMYYNGTPLMFMDANLSHTAANLTVTGVVTGGSFSGVGSLLTSLNASNISSGTLDNARLPSTINISGDYQISGTSVITSARDLVSCGIQLGFSNPIKCNLVVDAVGGADHAFGDYMSIFMNGVQVWVPYLSSAP